jgi:alpha-methylacyl-CoA racemase
VSGPLHGIRVLELVGQGPGPFACMLLADLGAEVVAIERVGVRRYPEDAHGRGRRSVCLDLKDPRGVEIALELVSDADVVVEGFRPGVTERLGLGPDECLRRNPALVYGRITGWGQDGPLARTAGHDIGYLAMSGVLDLIGEAGGRPVAPLNLLADYGAGGMLLALGVTAALLEVRFSGQGQVVDAAMVDGLSAMAAPFHAMSARGTWGDRGTNLLDGGAPYYGVYETADGRHLSVGAIERGFYDELLDVLGLEESDLGPRDDRLLWPEQQRRFAAAFAARTRDDWVEVFAGRDACVAPVLDLAESRMHPHSVHRSMFTQVDGVPQQAPAPRFSKTVLASATRREEPGASTDELLVKAGRSAAEVAALRSAGVVA